MTTAIRCVRCGGAETDDCSACETGLDLANLFRRTEELDEARDRAEQIPAFTHPGNHFGDFIRVQRLGDGGMGEVWKAWDRKLRRWVALKFPKCESGADLERLKAEATSAGIVAHPNVATVYGYGQANGHHFIAMQYIDGATLADYPRTNRRKLIAFVRYAAMGVACAHSHGIIHRDLKPENILVDREREQIYVTDFGIARPAASRGSATSAIGTPPYMSPEQARGEAVDGRGDVYSLTATLYDLLADRPPFVGDSPADTIQKVLCEEPRPLPHLDADLNAILLKGLEKSPSERYPTVLEFAEDLNRYLRDEPVRARRPDPFTWLRKMVSRHRAAAMTAAAGLAATLFVTVLLLSGRAAERNRREAEERDFAQREADRRAQGRRMLEAEEGKRSDLRELLMLWSRVAVAKQGWYQPRTNPQATRKEIEAAVSGLNAYVSKRPDQLQGYYVRARGRLYLDNLEGARSDLEKAIGIEPGFGPGWALLGRVKGELFFRNLIGDAKEYAARLRDATPLLQEANVAFQRSRSGSAGGWGLGTMEDEKVAEVLARAMALAYVDRNFEEARTLLEAAHREAPSEEYCNLLGVWAGDDERNIAWQTEALSIRPHYGMAYFDRGTARARRGDAAGALADYSKAIDAHPRFLPARFNRAQLLLSDFNEPGRALEDFAQMLKVNAQLAPVYAGRARARIELGDFAGALEELHSALALAPRDPVLHASRANVKVRLRDYRGAIEDATEALRLNPREAKAYLQRASAKVGAGDFAGAIDDSGHALLLDSRSGAGYAIRSQARNRSGDHEGARRDATEALAIDPRSAAPYGQRALAHLKLGETRKAMEDASEALKLDPRTPGAHSVRAAARARLGDLEGALSDACLALILDRRDVDAYVIRAAAYHQLGERVEAVADATEALAIDPRSVPALLVRAAARIAVYDFDGAVDDCSRALREDPRSSPAYLRRGVAREGKGDLRGAVEDATLAFMLDPRNADALSHRAAVRIRLGEREGAIRDLSAALALRPDDLSLRLRRASREDFVRAMRIALLAN